MARKERIYAQDALNLLADLNKKIEETESHLISLFKVSYVPEDIKKTESERFDNTFENYKLLLKQSRTIRHAIQKLNYRKKNSEDIMLLAEQQQIRRLLNKYQPETNSHWDQPTLTSRIKKLSDSIQKIKNKLINFNSSNQVLVEIIPEVSELMGWKKTKKTK